MELFWAITFSQEYREKLSVVCKELRNVLDEPRGYFEVQEKLHLTLSYVRNVDTLDNLDRLFNDQLVPYPAFSLCPGAIGCFVNEKETVVWLGVKDKQEQLAGLKRLLDEHLMGKDYDVEQWRYTPHITLAYLEKDELQSKDILEKVSIDLPSFQVEEIHLFCAPLSLDCASYEKLATFRLIPTEVGNG